MKAALLLALPLALLAQPAAQPVPQDPAKARLEGQVLNSVTGEPLRKARLTLLMNTSAATTFSAVSDSMGKFEFPNVAPGNYELSARRDGFAKLTLGSRRGARKSDPILLAAGDRKSDFLVRLVPFGSISGSIFDEDGDPIREINVSAMVWHYTTNGRALQEICAATTNDLGEYRIFDVPPGKYFIKVGKRNFRLNPTGDNGEAYGSVYYPGFPQISGAMVQEVAPGAQLHNLNFNLRRTHFATVRGRVVAPPNATSVNAGMMVVTDDGSMSTSTDVKGKDYQFAFFGVGPGQLYLIGNYQADGQHYTATLAVEVGTDDIEGIELRPMPLIDFGGTVRVAGRASVALSQLGLNLETPSHGTTSTAVRDDGSFAFPYQNPDNYRVNLLRVPESLYLKSIHWGTVEITDSSLDLTAGAAARTELSIVLGADPGQLEGVVTNQNAQPCEGATVTLIPTGTHRSRAFFKFRDTDAAGRFSIRGIPPGSYKVLAWDQVDNNAVMFDPDFLRPYEGSAEAVEIAAGGARTLDLKLTINKEQ